MSLSLQSFTPSYSWDLHRTPHWWPIQGMQSDDPSNHLASDRGLLLGAPAAIQG